MYGGFGSETEQNNIYEGVKRGDEHSKTTECG
jgi:hypothetical protein